MYWLKIFGDGTHPWGRKSLFIPSSLFFPPEVFYSLFGQGFSRKEELLVEEGSFFLQWVAILFLTHPKTVTASPSWETQPSPCVQDGQFLVSFSWTLCCYIFPD